MIMLGHPVRREGWERQTGLTKRLGCLHCLHPHLFTRVPPPPRSGALSDYILPPRQHRQCTAMQGGSSQGGPEMHLLLLIQEWIKACKNYCDFASIPSMSWATCPLFESKSRAHSLALSSTLESRARESESETQRKSETTTHYLPEPAPISRTV